MTSPAASSSRLIEPIAVPLSVRRSGSLGGTQCVPPTDLLARIARFALRTVTVHDRQQVMSRTTGTGH